MNKIEFEVKYQNKGGIGILQEFVNNLYTLDFISKHFGVTKQAVKLWLVDLYGENYDPRELRKEKIINSMIKFAEKHTEQEFRDAYYYISKYYWDIALGECIARGIFKTPKTRSRQGDNSLVGEKVG